MIEGSITVDLAGDKDIFEAMHLLNKQAKLPLDLLKELAGVFKGVGQDNFAKGILNLSDTGLIAKKDTLKVKKGLKLK